MTNRGDEGFTLIEVLVALAITGIIVGSIAAAFIVILRNSDTTQQRLSESHDAQLLASYLNTDVHRAETVTINETPTCNESDVNIAKFESTSAEAGTAVPVDYAVVYKTRIKGVERQLVRVVTDSSVSPVATETLVMAHNLKACAGGTSPDPAITAKNCFAGLGSCASKYVQLNVTDLTEADPAGYSFKVKATRRVS